MYLRERFHRTSEIQDYNLRVSNYDLQLPLPKTNFLKRSFSYHGAIACNQRSNKTRDIRDLTSFKFAISWDITFYYVLSYFYLISLMTHFLLLYCISNYYYFYQYYQLAYIQTSSHVYENRQEQIKLSILVLIIVS